jgi:translation initiation factor IF-3
VRLVGPDGQQIGIKPLPEALAIARAADLDLVEVAAQANPPVCRIMDYGKYKYEAAQKAKESRRKASNVSIKEMKYRPKISKGDFDTKTRKVERFLQDGHKVKVTLTFRGREMHHPELGRRILDDVVSAVEHLGKVEIFPRQDGRNMTMVLGPDRKAQAASERARRQTEAEGSTGGGSGGESGNSGSAGGQSGNSSAGGQSGAGAADNRASSSGAGQAGQSGTRGGTARSGAERPTPVSAAGATEGRPRQDAAGDS